MDGRPHVSKLDSEIQLALALGTQVLCQKIELVVPFTSDVAWIALLGGPLGALRELERGDLVIEPKRPVHLLLRAD